MTDQQMDARLRAAGERFRAENAGKDVPIDVDEIDLVAPVPGRRFRGLLVVAAAVVAALVVGLAIGLRGTTHPAPPSVDNAGLVSNVWLLSPGPNAGAALYISSSGALVADDECRLIAAKATVTGNHLTVSDMIERFKPCVDEHFGPGFYDKGARVLRGPATFRINSAGMTITRAGVGSLRFVLAQTPIPPPSLDIPTLTGTDWVAPSGKVLHIDPRTGQLSGGWCEGRAAVYGSSVTFDNCASSARGTYSASLTGATLTLTPLPSHAPLPVKARPKFAFQWHPEDPSIIEPASLTGRTWHLQTVNGTSASSGSLRIEGDTAVVDDGCSTYRRTVDVSAGTFAIVGRAPRHACTDQASTADSFVFNSPATWTVRAGKLIVYGGSNQTFALVYGSSRLTTSHQDTSALTAHTWQITTITWGTGHFRHGAAAQDNGFLSFTAHGYEVQHTCSIVHGRAQLAAGIMTLDQQNSDDHSCPAPAPGEAYRGESEQAINTILAGAVRWTVHGSVLTLSGGNGTLIAIGAVRSDLTGSRWRLAATSRGNSSRPAVGSVVLSFRAADRLRIDRCYVSGAKVAVGDSSFTVFQLHTTVARPCPSGPPGTQQQNETIDSVLTAEPLWSIVDNNLTLTGSGASLTFRR